MKNLIKQITDENYVKVKALIIDVLQYQDQVDDGNKGLKPNPLDHDQFVKKQLGEVLKKYLDELRRLKIRREESNEPDDFGL